MTRSVADLLLVGCLAVVTLGLALVGWPGGALRLILGLLLTLALPGYALTEALFPRPTLDATNRLLFTCGLSLVATILGGFVLNWTPWGLQPESWATLLSYLTLGGCLVAIVRRPVTSPSAQRPALPIDPGQALLFGLAALTLAGSVLIARGEAAQRPAPDVVQLWMLPGESQAIRLGVITKGPAVGSYRLVVLRGGYTIREWPALALGAEARWETTVDILERQPGSGPVEARLYRTAEPGVVYRQVKLWLEERR